MKIQNKNNNIILSEINDFELRHIFDCGQCFRFNSLGSNEYIGTAFGRTIRVSKNSDTVIFHNTPLADFENIWYDYFDLSRDYTKIKNSLKNDSVMRTAVDCGYGIRILRQDLWETVISFIISASNNIPRIKKIIELLCVNFGEPHEYENKVYYSFPAPEAIAKLSLEDLSVIRAGFRDKYILECAKNVVSGKIELDSIRLADMKQAKKQLMNIYGVGNKVAECVLLFGLGRFDSFPVDVWIKRIMEYCYFDNKPQSVKTISEYADKKFGALCGIAQQYLFFYARENKIGTD